MSVFKREKDAPKVMWSYVASNKLEINDINTKIINFSSKCDKENEVSLIKLQNKIDLQWKTFRWGNGLEVRLEDTYNTTYYS